MSAFFYNALGILYLLMLTSIAKYQLPYITACVSGMVSTAAVPNLGNFYWKLRKSYSKYHEAGQSSVGLDAHISGSGTVSCRQSWGINMDVINTIN